MDNARRALLIISTITVIVLIAGGYFMLNTYYSKISIPDTNARLVYIFNSRYIDVSLSKEESELLINMFNGKKTYSDNPSCGFTENVSIRFDNLIFCIARDRCPIIKFGEKYFNISDKDREILNQIFEKHGGSFPCI